MRSDCNVVGHGWVLARVDGAAGDNGAGDEGPGVAQLQLGNETIAAQ